MANEIFKELEPGDSVPPYLKEALVSEIDFIRDTLQIVTLYTEGFFSTAATCLSEISNKQES
jgi:hypothetical protein